MIPQYNIDVKVTFSDNVRNSDGPTCSIAIQEDGSESLRDVKSKIAKSFGGTLTADHIQLYFGPNDRKIGCQFLNDPNIDEETQTIAAFSVLPWLRRFPSWHLGANLMPKAPPAPGVAIKKAAALAEGKDPDKAVKEARSKGELLKVSQLPPPWGPKPYKPSKDVTAQYVPRKYPATSAPAITVP